MKRLSLVLVLVLAAGLLAVLPGAGANAKDEARPFKAADLKVEINATDGDAGLQVFLDDEAWKTIKIVNPAGRKILHVKARGPLKDYGLTELFSESSEPPFDEFPLAQFKQLFPEGDYLFTGRLIDGTKLRSEVPLTHVFPEGPQIVSPQDGAELARDQVVIRWAPGTTRPGVDIVGYQALAVAEDGSSKTLSVDLPASARRLPVPGEFLQPHTEYKAEVLAIETSGNQTLTEVTFTVG
ncbi:MAG: fibronectin type III domain-containing protein [Actinomycetes bacterium]